MDITDFMWLLWMDYTDWPPFNSSELSVDIPVNWLFTLAFLSLPSLLILIPSSYMDCLSISSCLMRAVKILLFENMSLILSMIMPSTSSSFLSFSIKLLISIPTFFIAISKLLFSRIRLLRSSSKSFYILSMIVCWSFNASSVIYNIFYS